MKISINWLNDFVDLSGISNEELIKRLTLSTAEIEEVIDYGKNTSNVVVGKIISKEKSPNSNKLSVLKVDAGDRVYDVICGAPNCKEGMKVAFAKMGGEVNGFQIEKVVIAGHVSEGMCCSEKELGISEDHEGIMEVLEDIPLGTDIKKVYPIEDTVFEVDNKSLTNRPDLWCHYGFAREASAIFNRPLKALEVENLEEYNNLPSLNIKVEDAEKCYRYCGIKLDNVTRNISPVRMRIRLFYAGMRGLNLLADLTNYIMLEVGQPMHAFDSRKATNIVVKTLKEETKFKTLDEEEHLIDTNTLMICENDAPVAIAGIMGGLESEVEEDTTSILLESANFHATSIRKSATALGIRTEASMRYEKSLDPELTKLATERFIYLLKQLDNGVKVASNLTDVYPHKYETITIKTTTKYIEDYCGIKIEAGKIAGILTSLGFRVKQEKENLTVVVPSYRATKDVSIPADLVEEVARIYGYDNIVPQAVVGKIEPVEQENEHSLEYETKRILAEKFALSEVHSYLWNDVSANKELNIKTKGYVKVLNSTVKDNDEIRSELTPTLLQVINQNKLSYGEGNVFEIGRVVSGLDKSGLAVEEKHLAIALSSKTKTEEELYFELKNCLVFLIETFKQAKVELRVEEQDKNYLHPVNSTSILVEGKKIGSMGLLHPATLNAIDKKFKVATLEINFKAFSDLEDKKVKVNSLSKYQTTTLDFNFLAAKNACYFNLEILFANFNSQLDYTFKLLDVFEDDAILKGKKSYTFRFEIGASDHTLTGEEIEAFYNGLIAYAKENGLELR